MPRYFFRSVTLAVCTALLCLSAHAATPPEGAPAPNGKAQAAAPAKPSRPLYLSLPASVIHAFKKPVQRIRAWFSRDHAKQADVAGNDKNTRMGSAATAPTFTPERKIRPRSSMYIGLAPSSLPTDTPGPYHYSAAAADDNGCGTADRSRSGSTGAPEVDTRGSHLMSGLAVGFCMKF